MMPSDINNVERTIKMAKNLDDYRLLLVFGEITGWHVIGKKNLFKEEVLALDPIHILNILKEREAFKDGGQELEWLYYRVQNTKECKSIDGKYLERIRQTAISMFSSIVSISYMPDTSNDNRVSAIGKILKKMKIFNGLIYILLETNSRSKKEWLMPDFGMVPEDGINRLKNIGWAIAISRSLLDIEENKPKTAKYLTNSLLRAYDFIDGLIEGSKKRYIIDKARPYGYYLSFFSEKDIIDSINNSLYVLIAETLGVLPPKNVCESLCTRLIHEFFNTCGFPDSTKQMQDIVSILEIVAITVPFSEESNKKFFTELNSAIEILDDNDNRKKELLLSNLHDIEWKLVYTWRDSVNGEK